jgi:hypothetical protein
VDSDKSLVPVQHSTPSYQQPIMRNHQLVIIAQLLQNISHLQTLDEVFHWFAHVVMRRLDIKVVQVWALQNYIENDSSIELRAMACQNPMLLTHKFLTSSITEFCKKILEARCNVPPQHITTVFFTTAS